MGTTDHNPQHIRRRCSQSTYEAVERGRKTFELFVGDDIRLEEDDIVTLEEWDPTEKKYTGRWISRKVTHILNTKDAGIHADEVNRYGVTICSTLHPDFHSLRSLFTNQFLTALILEKKEGSAHEVINGPFYVPPFSTPDFYEMGIYDRLGLEHWPVGVYDITLLVRPDTQRDRFIIVDQRITGAVYVVNDDGSQGIEVFELSPQGLQIGKVKRLDGKELQLADPEEVKQLTHIEEVVDLPSSLRITDSLSRGVDEHLEELLEEAGIEHEEDVEGNQYVSD